MKSLFASILMLASFAVNAQENIPAYQDTVTIEVNMKDHEGKPEGGIKVVFESTLTKAEYAAISDSLGLFSVDIPGPDAYLIKIKGFGIEQDYNEIKIPELGEDESYGTYKINITFEAPKEYTLDDVHFETGNAKLTTESFAELDELHEYLTMAPDIKVEIGGHTDNVGEADANLKLSQQRAESVRNYLIKKGISANRITAKGYGEDYPIGNNDTEAGRQKNRRTEVKVFE